MDSYVNEDKQPIIYCGLLSLLLLNLALASSRCPLGELMENVSNWRIFQIGVSMSSWLLQVDGSLSKKEVGFEKNYTYTKINYFI